MLCNVLYVIIIIINILYYYVMLFHDILDSNIS